MSFTFLCVIACACIVLQPTQCFGYQLISSSISRGSITSVQRQFNYGSRTQNQISHINRSFATRLLCKVNKDDEIKEPSAFDQVASKGLAGVLAIAAAEA